MSAVGTCSPLQSCPSQYPFENAWNRLRRATVRPWRRLHSRVKVLVGESQNPVAEGNCVAVRRGGEQPEANWRSAGIRTRFGGEWWRACSGLAKPETHCKRCMATSDLQTTHVLGGGTSGSVNETNGETCAPG